MKLDQCAPRLAHTRSIARPRPVRNDEKRSHTSLFKSRARGVICGRNSPPESGLYVYIAIASIYARFAESI